LLGREGRKTGIRKPRRERIVSWEPRKEAGRSKTHDPIQKPTERSTRGDEKRKRTRVGYSGSRERGN